MRITYINCVYEQGSTGKIVRAQCDYERSLGNEAYVLYGLGPVSDDPGAFKVASEPIRKAQVARARATGIPYGGCFWGTHVALRRLATLKPDIVHLHCPNACMVNIYKILHYLKQNDIPTVITNHAEYLYTGGCTHAVDCDGWLKGCGSCKRLGKEHPISWFFDRTAKEWSLLKEAYSGFRNLTVCCVSDWVTSRARRSPFFEGYDVVTVLNGLDSDIFRYREDCQSLRDDLALHDARVVLHVTPEFSDPIKGGRYVARIAQRFPDTIFLIVGNAADKLDAPSNCKFLGPISDQLMLSRYYSLADACLITSVRETFSMVTAESLCCGTPVVGFLAGGPESIAVPEYSRFVEQDDADALELALAEILSEDIDHLAISDSCRPLYGQRRMCERYHDVYEKALLDG